MISTLIPGMSNVNLIAQVISIGERRSVNTKYGKTQVCDAVIKDETGEVNLTLWEEQIEKVKEGDEIELQGGYTTEWQGEVKLSVPRKGSIEKKE